MALDVNYSCPIIWFLNISSKYDEKYIYFSLFYLVSVLSSSFLRFLAIFYGSLVTVRGTGSKKMSQ